jgi:hypothetical protein
MVIVIIRLTLTKYQITPIKVPIEKTGLCNQNLVNVITFKKIVIKIVQFQSFSRKSKLFNKI